MVRALVFPGQGSQTVGMGRDIANALLTARAVFEEVDDALSQNLSRLMFEGPIEELTLTENAQPALMAMSVAIIRVLSQDGGMEFGKHYQYVAGHSLGEYSALCAANVFPLDITARLLKKRGQAMQKAVPVGQGAMAALLGLEFEAAESVAKDAAGNQICDVANDNAPGQVVVSGNVEAVHRAVELAKKRGARRPVLLPVSAPFHSSLMQPAADTMEETLEIESPNKPTVPVVTNVAASAVSDPAVIRKSLVEQITSMVRWRESIIFMRDQGVERFVEVGPGKVLTTILKRIDRDVTGLTVGSPEDIEDFLKSI